VQHVYVTIHPMDDSLLTCNDVVDHLRISGMQSTIHTLTQHMNVLNLEEVTPKGIEYSINNIAMEHKYHLKSNSRDGNDDRLMDFFNSKFVPSFCRKRKSIAYD